MSIIRFFLILSFCSASLSAAEWVRNTYPGPGHVENEGPWGPGQGSDRTEYMSFYRVHPANAKFMLQGTDLGRLVYTNTRLGGTEFIAAEVPVRHTATCSFDPHDPHTAYVLLVERYLEGKAGWWKTVDEGESWYQVLDTPADRTLFNLLSVNPDPARKNEVYVGTRGTGLWRSSDGGESFQAWLMPDAFIYHMSMDASGDFLYAIALEFDPDQKVSQQQLYRVDLMGGVVEVLETFTLSTPLSLSSSFDFPLRFVEAHPVNPGMGLLVNLNDLYAYSTDGHGQWSRSLTTTPSMASRLEIVRYNPANPQHLIAQGFGGSGFTGNFQWSSDGGTTWNQWSDSSGITDAFTDFGPHNHHRAPDYYYPSGSPNSVRHALYFDFIPGDPDAVVGWDFGYYKGPMRSDDYGAHFRLFAHGGNFKNPSQIAVGQTDDVVVVSHVEGGVTMTRNGGLSWKSFHPYNTPAFPQNRGSRDFWRYRTTWGAGVDPANDQIVLVTAGWDPVRILRTEDFGTTWSEVGQIDIATIPAYSEASLQVKWDRTNTARVYIHNIRNINGGTSFTDGSATLTTGNTLLTYPVTTISDSNGAVILSKKGGRDWFLSQDAGANWVTLPDPPNATDGITTAAVTPNRHVGAMIDPDPMKDPTLDNSRRIRILNGGQAGIWEFNASNASGSAGSWRLLPGSSPNVQPHTSNNWLLGAAVDPRPGEHDTIYGLPGYCGGTIRGDLGFRQVYRSIDGGSSWGDLYSGGQQGELPDYVTAQAYTVSPNTGALYICDLTGLYRFVDDSSQAFRLVVDGGIGDGLYSPGVSPAITAVAPTGKTFSHWEGDWFLLESLFDPSASLTTVAAHTSLTAVFNDIGAVPAFADWFDTEFPSTPISQRGWLDDPDLDGQVNGIEYFTGSSPIDSGSLRNPVAGLEWIPTGWRVTLHRRLGVQGMVPFVETGTDLGTWGPAAPVSYSISEAGGLETIQLDIDSTDPAFFSRAVIRSE